MSNIIHKVGKHTYVFTPRSDYVAVRHYATIREGNRTVKCMLPVKSNETATLLFVSATEANDMVSKIRAKQKQLLAEQAKAIDLAQAKANLKHRKARKATQRKLPLSK